MSPRAIARPRPVARPDVAGIVVGAAVRYLANRGRGAHIEQVVDFALEALVRELLEADPRFVQSAGGVLELADVRDERRMAVTRAPEPVEAADELTGAPEPVSVGTPAGA